MYKRIETTVKTILLSIVIFPALNMPLNALNTDSGNWLRSYPYGLMPITERTVADRQNLLRNSERISVNSFPRRAELPTQVNLLSYFDYTPVDRNQGHCGSCWLWASSGLAAIDLNLNKNVKDNLSVQFALTYLPFVNNINGCDGGNPSEFVDYYNRVGYFIPTSNTNASFNPTPYESIIYPNTISTDNRYYLDSVIPQIIDVGQDTQTAIEVLKTTLSNNIPVYFGFHMSEEGWKAFEKYWDEGDSTPWTFMSSDNHSYIENVTLAGGHATMLIGYDDPQGDGSGYWIILNSWSTANGLRPEGTFNVAMNIDYQAESAKWQTASKCLTGEDDALHFYTYSFSWAENVLQPDEKSNAELSFSSNVNDKKGTLTFKSENTAWILEDDTPDSAVIYINTNYPQATFTCDAENGTWNKTRNGYTYKSSRKTEPTVNLILEKTKSNSLACTIKIKDGQMSGYFNLFNGFGTMTELYHSGEVTAIYSSPFLVYKDIETINIKAKQK